jgi:uncharacterized membrane protein YedE/YeeE
MAPNVIYDPVGLGRGFAGGVGIGLVSTSLLYTFGKTLGVSGILGALVRALRYPSTEPVYWQLSFISGMLAGGGILLAVPEQSAVFGLPLNQHWAVALVGGLLVGFGTRLGCGCTSGHGVSGLPRLSPRSLVNVAAFMGSGLLSAGLSRAAFARPSLYPGGTSPLEQAATATQWALGSLFIVPLVVVLGVCAAVLSAAAAAAATAAPASKAAEGAEAAPPSATPTPTSPPQPPSLPALVLVLLHGLAFGLALGLSGMCDPSKVLRFLDIVGDGGWDPQLMLVMGGAVAVNAVTFRVLALHWGGSAPPLAQALGDTAPGAPSRTFSQIIAYGPSAPGNGRVTAALVAGGMLFGLGWGLCGVCPGPGIVDFVSGGSHFGVAVPATMLGMAAFELLKQRTG